MVASTRPFFGLFTDERKIRVLELAVNEYERDNGRLRAIRDAVLALHPLGSYPSPGVEETHGGRGVRAGMLPVFGCSKCRTVGPCATRQACGISI